MKEGFIFSWFNYFYYKVYKDEFVTLNEPCSMLVLK